MSSTVRLPLIDEQLAHLLVDRLPRLARNAGSSVGTGVVPEQRREVVADRVRQHEVAVGEALHQRRRAEPVGAVIGEVRLAEHEQPGQVAHQVVVDPQPTHRVVDRRVDAHRDDVRVLAGDALVHLEEVAVALLDDRPPEPLDRLREVEVDAVLQRPDAATGVDLALDRARRDVARHEVAERRVAPLEEVVAVVHRDLVRGARVVHLLRHPHPAVVAQRLRHQRELRLEVVARRDARGVDLREARVGHVGAALRRPPRGGDVRVLRVRRQVEHVAVATGREHDRVARHREHVAAVRGRGTRCRTRRRP